MQSRRSRLSTLEGLLCHEFGGLCSSRSLVPLRRGARACWFQTLALLGW